MRTLLFLWLSLAALLASAAVDEQKPNIAGDYAGTLGPLHLKLHVVAAPGGTLTGTLDSTDQGAIAIPCQNFQFDGHDLSFSVPAVRGAWKGNFRTPSWRRHWPKPTSCAPTRRPACA